MTSLLASLLVAASLSTAPEAAGEPSHDMSNHLGLFGGLTVAEGVAHPTIGAEYEFVLPVLHHLLGVGPLAEFVTGDPSHLIFAGALYLHPVGGLKLIAASGYEQSHGHAALLLRAGAGYDLHVGDFAICPCGFVDLVDGHLATVAGLAFEYGF